MKEAISSALFYGKNHTDGLTLSKYTKTNRQTLEEKGEVQIPSFRKNHDESISIKLSAFFDKLTTSFQMISIHDIDFSKIIPGVSGLFALEYHLDGKRNCFILDYKTIFEDCLRSYPHPHLYEVIPAGFPSHLYFDVEFLFSDYPDYNGPEIVQQLLDLVDDKLFDFFGIDDYEVINLDATSETKFSRHLIIKCPGFAFQNNKHVGFFVHNYILPFLPQSVKNSVDAGVYSNNRTFRCVWCTKFKTGKNPLVPIDGKNLTPMISTLSFFISTLISNVSPTAYLYSFPNFCETFASSSGFIKVTTVCNNNSNNNNNNILSNPNIFNQELGIRVKTAVPSLEQYVIDKLAPGGISDSVIYIKQSDVVAIKVKGTRFCHNIGREHKSNQIYLLCRLSYGLCVQKCFDPDCKGFESSPIEIPEDILAKAREYFHHLNHPAPKKYDDFL